MLLGDTYSLVIFCLILCKPTPTKFVRDRLHRPTPRLPNHHALELLNGHKAALAAARSEWQRIQRSLAEFELTLGRADISPEPPVTAQGYKPEIDATPWIIDEVTHNFTERGYTCSIRMERR